MIPENPTEEQVKALVQDINVEAMETWIMNQPGEAMGRLAAKIRVKRMMDTVSKHSIFSDINSGGLATGSTENVIWSAVASLLQSVMQRNAAPDDED